MGFFFALFLIKNPVNSFLSFPLDAVKVVAAATRNGAGDIAAQIDKPVRACAHVHVAEYITRGGQRVVALIHQDLADHHAGRGMGDLLPP